MTNSIYDNEEWRLSCFLDWVPKTAHITCPTCHGKGETGGGFKSIDGPTTCSRCHGAKYIEWPPEGQKPDIPKELLDYMKDAWERFNFMRNPEPVELTKKR